MSDENTSSLDPRFDPAFQRGFDQSTPIEHYVPAAPARRRPEVTLPVVPASQADEEPAADVPDETPVSLDPVEHQADTAPAAAPIETRNPYLLALLIVGIVLIIAGVLLFVQTGNEFNSSQVQSQGDYMSLNATIEMAPFISLLGGATLIGVIFLYAVRYRRRR